MHSVKLLQLIPKVLPPIISSRRGQLFTLLIVIFLKHRLSHRSICSKIYWLFNIYKVKFKLFGIAFNGISISLLSLPMVPYALVTLLTLVIPEDSCVQPFVTLQTAAPKLPCPWDSPDKNTGVGCHALLQGISSTQGSNPGLLHRRRILYSGT